MKRLVLLSPEESAVRLSRLRSSLADAGIDAALISDNANIYYLTGRVFAGYVYVPAVGPEIYFVRRPIGLEGDGVVYIRKPEQIAETIGLNVPATLALELDVTTWSDVSRLSAIFGESKTANASPLMRRLRAVKTEAEIRLMKISGEKQERVYRRVPHLYRQGMTDMELQVEIERLSRLEGCLGQFRISGDSMELYMGSVGSG